MLSYAITGASGFVGSALVQRLRRDGHTVLRLVRGTATAGDTAAWDPATGAVDADRLAGIDAVVHLAGENVAGGRWTGSRMQRIHDSRIVGTANLCRALAALPQRPKVLVCASAIGFYGDRGDTELDERSAPGGGFLADVVRGWETATAAALHAGIRVVSLRIGLVLGPGGGALAKMLLPFRLGLGGRLGSGHQYVSWIALDDLVAAITFAAAHAGLAGAINATAPQPVTNREFTKALGRALHRPAVMPVPAFALRLLLGRFADEVLLSSQRVLPKRLLDAGFAFAQPQLAGALTAALRR
jgi:uncharacterized protein (TIGR01777 family)